ncbi:MAG: element excision factor XisH family protein [bacterium]|nr:element excision factor XisH family protein [bacterium]
MPAIDICQPQVIRALEKDGWNVQQSPFHLADERRSIFVDALMIKGINGTRQQLLLTEIKCFSQINSMTHDLYSAIGQYLIYRALLQKTQNSIPLYLVVPLFAYETIFDNAVMRVISETAINLIVVNLDMEEIVQWKPHLI